MFRFTIFYVGGANDTIDLPDERLLDDFKELFTIKPDKTRIYSYEWPGGHKLAIDLRQVASIQLSFPRLS